MLGAMATPDIQWTWSPPRASWLVVGTITTTVLVILGSVLITMALTLNTRYERLGLMLLLVVVLAAIAAMMHVLRRNIDRLRLEADEHALRWSNLKEGWTRRIAWSDLAFFHKATIHRRGHVVRHELRIHLRDVREPLILGEDVANGERHARFLDLQEQLIGRLKRHGIRPR
jgi:hypothetical protein